MTARLATAAISTIRSLNAWPGSSRVAWDAVADASIRRIVSQTQTMNATAAASQPISGAELHPTVSPATTATTSPAVNSVASRARDRAEIHQGSDVRLSMTSVNQHDTQRQPRTVSGC